MQKVFGDGQHNAFTDLVRWHDRYYLCFRHGAGHLSMDGEIRVMVSQDLKGWEPCGTLDTLGDDRDPHFTMSDKALYTSFGTWDLTHVEGSGLPGRGKIKTYMAFSEDGTHWSEIKGMYEPYWWLWRVRWQGDAFYSVAYRLEWPSLKTGDCRFLRSPDGVAWSAVSTVTQERMPDEADWLVQKDQSILSVIRTCDDQGDAMLLRSDPERKQWKKKDLGVLVHSPVMVTWKSRTFVAGRGKGENGSVTRVWELANDKLVELVTLPSGGDTGYPGLVVDPATADAANPAFFISWYSQHERQPDRPDEASIYVARTAVEP